MALFINTLAALIVLAGVPLTSTRSLAAGTDHDLESILSTLAQRKHAHVEFDEQITSSLLKNPLRASGELFFDAPDRLEKRTSKPAPEDLVVEADVVTIVRGRRRNTMRLSEYPPLRPLLEGIRAVLAGDLPTLQKTFQITVDRADNSWTLTLRPSPAQAAPLYELIRIRGGAGIVRSVMMQRTNGDRTEMFLTEPAE
jgi:hypothetical protein